MEMTNPFQFEAGAESAPVDFDALQRQELLAVERIQNNFAKLVGDDFLPFLAMAPYVPQELAERWSIRDLDKLLANRMVQTGPGPAVWKKPVIWMERPAGESALANLRSRRPREFARLVMSSLTYYGAKAMDFADGKAYSPQSAPALVSDQTLFRFATLAAAAGVPDRFRDVLKTQVEGALRQARAAEMLWSPEARAWIEAGEPFGAALEGAFFAAVAAVKRRFELFHRHAHDSALLRTYFPRQELDDLFWNHLRDEEHWALHFVGTGGSGKTMLIRHLAAEAETKGVAVSRIDFDYLNPRYPERDPLLLLKALSEEFRLDESSDSVRAFYDFDGACEQVYRRLEDAARYGDAVRASLKDEDVRRAVHGFAEALASLSHEAQPVLILDTCEELAKVQPGGDVPRNVQHTLDLLDAVYQAYRDASSGARGLRIVFSGRRPLPPLNHLKVCRIPGFTDQEAFDFLDSYATTTGRKVPPSLIPGILKLTADEDGHVPYDLDTYAAWAAVDEKLTEEKLTSSGPLLYIQERIVDRLDPTVRRVFPALATMGRFDSEVVASLIGPTENPASDLAEVLSQEWIHADSAGAADTWRLEELFRQRVLKFYKVESAARQEARNRLARLLPPLTRTRPFAILTPQLFAACLDVLGDTPVQAARWWEEMEARIAAEAEWQWAANLMTFLEPNPEDQGPMIAAIFATKAAVMLHTGHDPAGAWHVVESRWQYHPDPQGAQRLQWRVACATGKPDIRMERLAWFAPQDLASLASYLERADWSEAYVLRIYESFLPGRTAPELAAYMALLVAVYATPPIDPSRFNRALELCRDSVIEPRQVWLDWIRPANLKDRILLEFARCAPLDFPGAHFDLLKQLFEGPLTSIDSDRLACAWLQLEQRRFAFNANPYAQEFNALFSSSVGLVSQEPSCPAHQAFPPFFIALLEARGMAGAVDSALTDINALSASQGTLPAGVKRELDNVLVKIMVRWRLTSEGMTLPIAVTQPPVAAIDFLAGVIAGSLQVSTPGIRADLTSPDPLQNAELQFVGGGVPDVREALGAAESRHDDAASLEAHMLLALSHARLRKLDAARAEALAVQPFYQRLTSGRPNVPSWDDILQAAQSGDVAPLLGAMGRKPAVWRPWVVRLLACLTAHGDPLAEWISANDVTLVDGLRRVPTELEFVRLLSSWAAPPPTAPPQTASPAAGTDTFAQPGPPLPAPTVEEAAAFPLPGPPPSPSAAPRSRLRMALDIGFGIVAIALAVWGLYVAYKAALSLIGVQLPKTYRVGSFFVVVPTLFYLSSLLPRVFELFLDLYARSFQLISDVILNQEPTDINRPLLSPSVWYSRTSFFGRLTVTNVTRNMPATTKERYREILLEILPNYQANSAMLRFLRLFPRLFFRCELAVDSNTAAAPWEALMAPNKIIQIRRVTRRRRGAVLPEWSAPVEVLTWGGNTLYSTRPDWGTSFHASFAGNPDQFMQSNEKVGVARILARPFDSATGPALQVATDNPSAPYTVRGADLAPLYPCLRMCIVQCPTAEMSRRLSSDRRNAAILRRVAADIFAAGVPVVIVIPVLPERAAEVLIDEIYRVLGRRPANAVPQLEAVFASFRRKPPLVVAPNPEDADEILQDLCLYAVPSVSLKANS